MAVQMELHKIIISDVGDSQVIVLKEVDGERAFRSSSAAKKRKPSTGVSRAFQRPAR